MPVAPLILASTSPYRRELLERLAVPFSCVKPPIDEEHLKDPALAPRELALHLAHAKAASVAALHPEAVVIGGDQVAECDGKILGKPGTVAGACAQLASLAGRSHRLLTAIAIHGPAGLRAEHVDVAVLKMRPLTDEAIARYIALDQPLDCAGAYKLERLGIALFQEVTCADHTAIMGLPLLTVADLLRRAGFPCP